MQECNIGKKLSYDYLRGIWKGDLAFSGRNECKSDGIGILCSNGWKITRTEDLYPGRLLWANVDRGCEKLEIFCMYAYTEKRLRKHLFELLQLFLVGPAPIIVGGDCQINNKKDGSAVYLKGLLSDCNLSDAWVMCGERRNDEVTRRNRGSESRLDYFYVSNTVKCESFKSVSNCFSDHNIIECNVSCKGAEVRKSAYWKLNVSLLKEVGIKEECENLYGKIRAQKRNFSNNLLWWDFAKKRFKEFFIRIGKRKGKKGNL